MDINVPEIERLAGIECYCTKFLGLGGKIKTEYHDFIVKEIFDFSTIKISNQQDNVHKFPIYLLEKSGIDSNHAILEIKKKYGIGLKIMGIKDAKAITSQFTYSEQKKQIYPELLTKHTRLSLKGFSQKPISKSNMLGNEFYIKINDTRSSEQRRLELAEIEEFKTELKKIGNFYGLQRFGSERLVTHLVGRELVKGRFENAIKYLLTYTSKYDTSFSKEIREKFRDPKNYPSLIKKIPRGMDLERRIIQSISEGKDYIHIIRTIPINVRRLFIHAYQAYIFNKTLSSILLNGENIFKCEDEDLCFELKYPMSFGKIRKFNRLLDRNENQIIPAIRLVGFAFQPGKGRFDRIIKEILKDEEVEPKDFFLKEFQELSDQGGFRQAPLCCIDFDYNKQTKQFSFKLPKGSYATTLLRELMKPKDPIYAGF